jgi:hypothetical protein
MDRKGEAVRIRRNYSDERIKEPGVKEFRKK